MSSTEVPSTAPQDRDGEPAPYDRHEQALTQAYVAGQMDAQATEQEKWKVGRGGTLRALSRRIYAMAQETIEEPAPWRFCPWCGEPMMLHLGDPEKHCAQTEKARRNDPVER